MGIIYMFGGSHESDFHNVTRYGSKMCHRSVTGVTGDTTRCSLGQCPPFRAEPTEAKKKEKGKEFTCRKEITIFRTEIRKKKGRKKKVRKIRQKKFTSSYQGKKKILACLSQVMGTKDS